MYGIVQLSRDVEKRSNFLILTEYDLPFQIVIYIDDGFVLIVKGGDMHERLSFGRAGMFGQKSSKLRVGRHGRGTTGF